MHPKSKIRNANMIILFPTGSSRKRAMKRHVALLDLPVADRPRRRRRRAPPDTTVEPQEVDASSSYVLPELKWRSAWHYRNRGVRVVGTVLAYRGSVRAGIALGVPYAAVHRTITRGDFVTIRGRLERLEYTSTLHPDILAGAARVKN